MLSDNQRCSSSYVKTKLDSQEVFSNNQAGIRQNINIFWHQRASRCLSAWHMAENTSDTPRDTASARLVLINVDAHSPGPPHSQQYPMLGGISKVPRDTAYRRLWNINFIVYNRLHTTLSSLSPATPLGNERYRKTQISRNMAPYPFWFQPWLIISLWISNNCW